MTPGATSLRPARLAAATLCSALPLLGAAAPEAVPGAAQRWHFTVLLDGEPIGWQDWTVTGPLADAEVQVRASLRVTALRIPVYTYEHTDQERWRGGCLSQIDAHTRDNGHEYLVHGQFFEDTFEVRGPQGSAALHGCIKSFAYWDARTLAERRLLNAQTGEYEAVSVSDFGRETLNVAGRDLPAEHYALVARKYTIELWYSLQGEWLALQTHADGRRVRYEMRP